MDVGLSLLPRPAGLGGRAGRAVHALAGLRTTLHALCDALAPPLCVLCRSPPGALPWLCERCLDRLTLIAGPVCLRCGAPRPLPAPLCRACPDWPRKLEAARAGAAHTGAARELVHALKYRSVLAAARPLGVLAAAGARALPVAPPPDTVVVPVPLHRSRRRERGFNQADEIARVVATELDLARTGRWLRRIRDGPGQVHRTRRGRWRATRGAFRAHRAVRGRPVLLVDDVCTTGATLGACARALARRGAAAVWAVSATRAPAPP